MSSLSVFNFKSNEVRVVLDENSNPLFVAKDVAMALGYSDTVNAIKQHCKGVAKHHPIKDDKGRTQKPRVIYEPDVYRLIFGSKLEGAIEFQNWTFEEVLPTIRKTGSYTLTINVAQQAAIKSAVNDKAYREQKTHGSIYNAFYIYFDVPRYQELPALKFNEAMLYLTDGFKKAATNLVELPKNCIVVRKDYIERIIHHIGYLSRDVSILHPVLRQLGSPMAGSLAGHTQEIGLYASLLKKQHGLAERITK